MKKCCIVYENVMNKFIALYQKKESKIINLRWRRYKFHKEKKMNVVTCKAHLARSILQLSWKRGGARQFKPWEPQFTFPSHSRTPDLFVYCLYQRKAHLVTVQTLGIPILFPLFLKLNTGYICVSLISKKNTFSRFGYCGLFRSQPSPNLAKMIEGWVSILGPQVKPTLSSPSISHATSTGFKPPTLGLKNTYFTN